MTEILPAVFIGHGNPMNALQHNAYTDAWRRIGEETARPRATLCDLGALVRPRWTENEERTMKNEGAGCFFSIRRRAFGVGFQPVSRGTACR